MPQTSYHCIDPRVLFRTVDNDIASFRDLSRTYLEIAPPMFERLEQALQTGVGLAHACHTLKGATVLVGAVQLTDLLAAMEHAARDGQKHEGVDLLPGLRRLFLLSLKEVRSSLVNFNGHTVPAAEVAVPIASLEAR